jgi:hypothetical protein
MMTLILMALVYLVIGWFVSKWFILMVEDTNEIYIVGWEIVTFAVWLVIWPITLIAGLIIVVFIFLGSLPRRHWFTIRKKKPNEDSTMFPL